MPSASQPTTRAAGPGFVVSTTAWALALMAAVSSGQDAGEPAIVPGAPAADEAALLARAAAGAPGDPTPADEDGPAPPARALDLSDPRPFHELVPGSTAQLEFTPVRLGEGEHARVLWFGRREVTWDAFDVYVFRLDDPFLPADAEVDGLARPSNPFALADRGYGHAGYPAISISHASAAGFAEWLAARTGRAYRLPSEDEWTQACEANGIPVDTRALDAVAWTKRNAERKTHAVGRLAPGEAGLHDLLGNVAEWCDVAEGKPVLMGGSFESRPDAVGCASRAEDDPAWNATDPQIPRSPWWLADGPFAGFRLVCEAPGDG